MAIAGKEKYSSQKLEKLKEYLERNAELGKPIEYEIVVDGLRAVQRTDNSEHFDLHEAMIDADTRSVEVIFYKGSSNHNEKRIFFFSEESLKESGLSGINIEGRIQEEIDKTKKQWELDLLKQQNQELTEELQELELELEQSQKQLQEIISKQSPLNGILGEVGSSFVESFIRRNPQLLAALPGGTALAGVSEENQAKPSASDEAGEPSVSFKPKSNDASPSISEEDQAAITFVNQLKTQFQKLEFDKIILILEAFVKDKSKIDTILSIV